MADSVEEINRAAVRIARDVAAEGDALVAGNLSLTWAYDPAEPQSENRVRELFDRQLEPMVDEGVNFIIAETAADVLFGPVGARIMSMAVLISTFGCAYPRPSSTARGSTCPWPRMVSFFED